MKTLHDIYDSIYMENITSDDCVTYLKQKEFELAYDGFQSRLISNNKNESIEPDARVSEVWIVPKYCDGQIIGHVLGFNIDGKLKCQGSGDSFVVSEVKSEIVLASAREPWKPRMFKTVAAALKCAPHDADNVLVWRH